MTVAAERALASALARIEPVDAAAGEEAQRVLDAKTKPRGSLGELETLVCRVASIRRTASLGRLRPVLVVAAGDHGVAAEDVSAYPQEVTRQMLENFAAGGAAVNVLSREAGARLVVADAGLVAPVEQESVRSLRLGAGTANLAAEQAMTRSHALSGLAKGIELAEELAGEGFGLLALGDMGIANTTAAAALAAALLPAEPEAVCGRGTGIDNERLGRKVAVVRQALARRAADRDDGVGALADLGGFEIAVLAGACLGAAAARIPIVLDGFVTGAAALVAARLSPASAEHMIAAHRSPEPGHALVLAELGLRPLLDLGLRLGEGSGAALVLPLVQSALVLLAEMSTFEAAGVTDAGV
jgi:nicotinate-nucleotide--dimethylbenzimidazole phosphoribosyltransferase